MISRKYQTRQSLPQNDIDAIDALPTYAVFEAGQNFSKNLEVELIRRLPLQKSKRYN